MRRWKLVALPSGSTRSEKKRSLDLFLLPPFRLCVLCSHAAGGGGCRRARGWASMAYGRCWRSLALARSLLRHRTAAMATARVQQQEEGRGISWVLGPRAAAGHSRAALGSVSVLGEARPVRGDRRRRALVDGERRKNGKEIVLTVKRERRGEDKVRWSQGQKGHNYLKFGLRSLQSC